MTNTTRISQKISAKTIFGNMSSVLKDYLMPSGEGVEVPLFRLIGTADEIRPFSSNFGDGIALAGEFEAINLLTGESTIGKEAFFPGEINEMIANAMKQRDDKGEFVMRSVKVPVRDEKGEVIKGDDGKAVTTDAKKFVTQAVDFAFEIRAQYAPTSSTQYTYTTISLMGMKRSTKLDALKLSVPAFSSPVALPAPVLAALAAKKQALLAAPASGAPETPAAPDAESATAAPDAESAPAKKTVKK